MRPVSLGALALACGARSELLGGRQTPTEGTGGASTTSGGAAIAGTASTGGASGGGKNGGGPGHAGSKGLGGEQGDGGRSEAGAPSLFGGEGGASAGSPSTEAGAAGMAEPSVTDALWGKSFGNAGSWQQAHGIAVEPNGDFTLTGGLLGTTDFGQGTLGSPSGHYVYLAQFDTDGGPRWSDVYGGASTLQEGRAVAVAADGNLSVVGQFTSSIDFGGGALQSAGSYDAFLASFDHDGQYRYAKRFGDDSAQTASGVAVLSSGRSVLAGDFYAGVDLGGGLLTSAGETDAMAAGFDAQGGYQWSEGMGDAAAQRATAVARSSWDDSVFVVGQLQGKLRVGGCSMRTSNGQGDVWISWLDSFGNCLSNLAFGDDADQAALGVATSKDSANLIAVVGRFQGVMDIGGQVQAEGQSDAFVALLQADSSIFALRTGWIRRIGGAGFQAARGVAFDQDQNIVVVGVYEGEDAAIGLGPSAGQADGFAVKYDVSGNVLWARSFGADRNQFATAVGIDSQNNAYVAGTFQGRIPLSSGTLTAASAYDIWVAKLAP